MQCPIWIGVAKHWGIDVLIPAAVHGHNGSTGNTAVHLLISHQVIYGELRIWIGGCFGPNINHSQRSNQIFYGNLSGRILIRKMERSVHVGTSMFVNRPLIEVKTIGLCFKQRFYLKLLSAKVCGEQLKECVG